MQKEQGLQTRVVSHCSGLFNNYTSCHLFGLSLPLHWFVELTSPGMVIGSKKFLCNVLSCQATHAIPREKRSPCYHTRSTLEDL